MCDVHELSRTSLRKARLLLVARIASGGNSMRGPAELLVVGFVRTMSARARGRTERPRDVSAVMACQLCDAQIWVSQTAGG